MAVAHHRTVRHISSSTSNQRRLLEILQEKKANIVAVGLEWERSGMGIPFQKKRLHNALR